MIEIRDATGNTVAFLTPRDGVKDAWINQRLNEECTLSFSLPLTCPKWKEITPECRLVAGGREFVILRPDAVDSSRDEQGRLWGDVVAAESWVLLNKEYPTVSNDPDAVGEDLEVTIISGGTPAGGYPAGSAGSALSYLLEGSGWTLGICDVEGFHDMETEKQSLLQNIEKVQEIWGGYLVWDSLNKTVSLRAEGKWRNYHGFQIRYRKNQKNITRTTNNDITTRLYLFGENNLDIASVNGGKKYIENFSYTSTIYTNKYEDQNIDDPQELKDKGIEVLEKICRPRHTYRTQIVDLRTLPGYEHETFDIGDLVDVVDEELGTDTQIRIVGYKYNIFQPWQCELEIGEPEERLASRLADALDASRFVDEALRPNPTISNIRKGFIDTFATTINSADGKLVWSDAVLDAIEADEEGRETGRRVRLTPGGLGISSDGGQTFDTAVTGDGVLADKIICSDVYALSSADGYARFGGTGLRVFDTKNVCKVHIGQWKPGTFGFLIGESPDTNFQLKFDGTDLIFGDGCIKWNNLDAQTQENLKGEPGDTGPPGSYYAPSYLYSTYIGPTEIRSPYITGNAGQFHGTLTVGSGTNTAGISGYGTANSAIRFWAGSSYTYRGSAPFRVTQGGTLNATGATIEGEFFVENSGVTLAELVKNAYGGGLWINDIDGKRNIAIGCESGYGNNTGGTLCLYNKAPIGSYIDNYRRVEAGISSSDDAGLLNLRLGSTRKVTVQICAASNLGDWGAVAVRDSNEREKVSLYANSPSSGGELRIRNSSGSLTTQLTATTGKINNETIATQPWVNGQGFATQSWVEDRIAEWFVSHIGNYH